MAIQKPVSKLVNPTIEDIRADVADLGIEFPEDKVDHVFMVIEELIKLSPQCDGLKLGDLFIRWGLDLGKRGRAATKAKETDPELVVFMEQAD